MQEKPIALRGKGAIDCMCRTKCPIKDECNLISSDIVIVELPVINQDDENLTDLYTTMRIIMNEWEKGSEEDCRKKGNWIDGNPIGRFRTAIHWIKPIYKNL